VGFAKINNVNVASPIADSLEHLLTRRHLPTDRLRTLFHDIMAGRCSEAEIAALLVGLRMAGETAESLATVASVLREHMVGWDPGCDVLDTCGTGGDGLTTFNISTATAFVLAGSGVRVVKHGNRSVSSKSGSSDVLTALGVPLENDPVQLRRRLDEAGMAFCFAPHFHPAMKHVAPVRKALGIPTIFNCLGPLINPAGAKRQLLGVGRADLMEPMAGALALLGTQRALLVHGRDGLDEVSLASATRVGVVAEGRVEWREWLPEDFGLERVELVCVKVAHAQESADVIRRVLEGTEGPHQRLVLANAAAGLLAAQKAATLKEGVDQARNSIQSGRALRVLERLRLP